MKKQIITLLLTIVFSSLSLADCHIGISASWSNDNIDPNVKNQIQALNRLLFKNLMTRDVAGLKKMMSKGLLAKTEYADSVSNCVSGVLKTADFNIIDEYYVKNANTNIKNTLISTHNNSND